MSSRWTVDRRLPVRHALPLRKLGKPALRKILRAAAAWSLFAALLFPYVHWLPPALADASSGRPTSLVEDVFDALSQCQASLPEKERWRIAGAIHHESRRHGYDPLFVMALIQVESGCSPTARGEQGAVGLTQLKPSTARAVAKETGVPWTGGETLTHPVLNVQLGLAYLSKLERQFRDPYLAMVAFNKGPARVAGMTRQRARGAKYVRRVLSRYEDLTDEASAAESL